MKKRMMRMVGWMGMGSLVFLSSCLSDPPEDPNVQLQKEITAIDAYLDANGIIAMEDPTGVRMVVHILGSGLPAKSIGTTVDVDYVGRTFPNGALFDQGNLRLSLQNLINGWQIAFTKLPVGSEATLYIPSYWAYGTKGNQGIAPNTTLQFDVVFNEAVITSTESSQFKTDTTAIETYLSEKGITDAITDEFGVRYKITQTGNGNNITWYDRVKFKLSYKLITDDTKIIAEGDQTPSDANFSRPVDYIQGIMIGLQKLNLGAKGVFYIPSGYGFGPQGITSGTTVVPANSNLILELEVQDINP